MRRALAKRAGRKEVSLLAVGSQFNEVAGGRLKLEEADMEYCGIDLGGESSAVCIVDDHGEIVFEEMVQTEEEELARVFAGRTGVRCVIEACPLAEWLAGIVEKLGQTPVIIDARRAKALIATKKKTDKIDARKLAQMARTGWYTEVHRKSAKARQLRTWLQAREGMVEVMRMQGSRIRGLLRSHGIRLKKAGRRKLAERVREVLEAQPQLRPILEPLIESWEHAVKSMMEMEEKIAEQAYKDPVCELLMSVPGVGPLVASAFMATIDDPHRFKKGKQVAAYLGLVPAVYDSAEVHRRGRITKEGDGMMRRLLVEAAMVLLHHVRSREALQQWGLDLAQHKGIGKARVAVARKLSMLLHRLWVTGEMYDSLRAWKDRCKTRTVKASDATCQACNGIDSTSGAREPGTRGASAKRGASRGATGRKNSRRIAKAHGDSKRVKVAPRAGKAKASKAVRS
jgi:transposase